MTFKKTKLALGVSAVTLSMAGILVAPQAVAGKSEAGNSKVQALESQVNQMADMLRSMQSELDAVRAEAANRPAPVEAAPAPKEAKVGNLIFFRGGFARMDSKRNDLLTGNQFGGDSGLATDVPNVLGGGRTNKDGYYIGAGFDFGLTDNVWGLMDDTDVMAELMFEYKNFGAKHFNNNPAIVAGSPLPNAGVNPTPDNGPLCTLIQYASTDELQDLGTNPNGAGRNACNGVTVTQFSLTASPKIKFMKGSALRPWIIPIGLGIHVISPPSNGVTVLNPGMMFAAGAEYDIWKAIKIGADFRYHLTGRSVDGVNTDGLTAGGYLGIGF